MADLAELVERLEDPEIEIETALKLYEEGVKLSGAIQHTLEEAEQRVAQVTEDGSLLGDEETGEDS
jgi:exodeoxyribonuclease VII small subunit